MAVVHALSCCFLFLSSRSTGAPVVAAAAAAAAAAAVAAAALEEEGIRVRRRREQRQHGRPRQRPPRAQRQRQNSAPSDVEHLEEAAATPGTNSDTDAAEDEEGSRRYWERRMQPCLDGCAPLLPHSLGPHSPPPYSSLDSRSPESTSTKFNITEKYTHKAPTPTPTPTQRNPAALRCCTPLH